MKLTVNDYLLLQNIHHFLPILSEKKSFQIPFKNGNNFLPPTPPCVNDEALAIKSKDNQLIELHFLFYLQYFLSHHLNNNQFNKSDQIVFQSEKAAPSLALSVYICIFPYVSIILWGGSLTKSYKKLVDLSLIFLPLPPLVQEPTFKIKFQHRKIWKKKFERLHHHIFFFFVK